MKVFYNIFRKKDFLYYFTLVFIILLAIFLRFKSFLAIRPLWHDECSLALSIIYKNYFDYFAPLLHSQSAPPLFMVLSKFFTKIFGISEFSLRLLPFTCSILSVFAFYSFSKLFLKNKIIILISNLLFALNFYVIYYSQEFKQYSTDVFLSIILFILTSKIDLKKISYKKILLYSFLFSIFPLFSIPSVFILFAYFLYVLIKIRDYKKISLLLFIPLLTLICYMFLVLLPQKEILSYFDVWNNGYLDLNFSHFIIFFKNNFLYFFYPNKFILFQIILLCLGIYFIFKNIFKKEYFLLFNLFLFIIIASLLHIYPVYQRLALYLVPFLIITMFLFIDLSLQHKNLLLKFLSICLITLSFGYYFSTENFKTLLDITSIQNTDSRSLMKLLNEKYKQADYIAINRASDSDFYFYAYLNKFNPKKILIVGIPKVNNEKTYVKQLNELPQGKYWFYYSYELSNAPVTSYLKKWKTQKENKVLYEFEIKNSYLLYLEHN